MDQDTFLSQGYQLKVNYLTNHFTRMWTRFNFFLTINSALFGFSFNSSYEKNEIYLIWAGIAFSILWFYFGAVDKYLATLYRAHVEHAFHLIRPPVPKAPSTAEAAAHDERQARLGRLSFVGDTGQRSYYGWDREHQRLGEREVGFSPWGFRWSGLSATDLAAFFPFVFLLAWVIRLAAARGVDWRMAVDHLC
jgi:hypothetical protein